MSTPQQQGCSSASILPLAFILIGGLIGWYSMGGRGVVVGIVGGIASCVVPLYLFALATSWLRRRAKNKRNQ